MKFKWNGNLKYLIIIISVFVVVSSFILFKLLISGTLISNPSRLDSSNKTPQTDKSVNQIPVKVYKEVNYDGVSGNIYEFSMNVELLEIKTIDPYRILIVQTKEGFELPVIIGIEGTEHLSKVAFFRPGNEPRRVNFSWEDVSNVIASLEEKINSQIELGFRYAEEEVYEAFMSETNAPQNAFDEYKTYYFPNFDDNRLLTTDLSEFDISDEKPLSLNRSDLKDIPYITKIDISNQ